MLAQLRAFTRAAFGFRSIGVKTVTTETVELTSGSVTTVFDKAKGEIRQNGKLIAMLPLVTRVELHRPSSQEGALNWYVTVHISGARQVEVGQESDDTNASTVGAILATITGKPVEVRP